jgi:CRISPR-associated protein Csb3
MDKIRQSHLVSAMPEDGVTRRQELSAMPKKARAVQPSLETEKKRLDGLWREAPVLVSAPFSLRIDWFTDERSGGKNLKTWAGQQSTMEIASGLQAIIDVADAPPESWLLHRASSACLPFNFDSDLGKAGSDLDVGFSFDPLKSAGLTVRPRPILEFLAFVGLQRFRPTRIEGSDEYEFSTWSRPLLPEVATAVACGLVTSPQGRVFRFRMLYRTKYLKSFLPANPK